MNSNPTSTVRRTSPGIEVTRPESKLDVDTLPVAADRDAIPVVSLFCGAGGLDRGFIQAGFLPILAIDKDEAACRTYEKNHERIRVLRRDLASAPTGYVIDRLSELPQDVKPVGVIGGPPCQAFSLSNRSPRRKDPRASLPENYAAILKELSKAYELDFFVFENVLGLRY